MDSSAQFQNDRSVRGQPSTSGDDGGFGSPWYKAGQYARGPRHSSANGAREAVQDAPGRGGGAVQRFNGRLGERRERRVPRPTTPSQGDAHWRGSLWEKPCTGGVVSGASADVRAVRSGRWVNDNRVRVSAMDLGLQSFLHWFVSFRSVLRPEIDQSACQLLSLLCLMSCLA